MSIIESTLTQWTDVAASGSVPTRSSYQMVYDSYRQTCLIHGGYPGTGSNYEDTWEYSVLTNTWTQVHTGGDGVIAYGMSYDSVYNRTYLYGGFKGTIEKNLYEWNGGTSDWTLIDNDPPSGERERFQMVYDAYRSKHVAVGGFNNSGAAHDIWEYDAGTDTWTDKGDITDNKILRDYAAAYCDDDHKVYYFCGIFGSYEFGSLVHTWDGTTWTNISDPTTHPSYRTWPSVVWNPKRHRFLLYGGWDEEAMQDTWEYDPVTNTWTEITSLVGDADGGGPMVYSTLQDRIIISNGGSTTYMLCRTPIINWQRRLFLPLHGISKTEIEALTRSTTVCCYDGTLDGSGNLINKTAASGRDLAPNTTSPVGIAELQMDDGNKWRGISCDGADIWYSCAAQTFTNILDQDCTVTVLISSHLAASGNDDFMGCGTAGTYYGGKFTFYHDTTGPMVRLYQPPNLSVNTYGPAVSLHDQMPHVIQYRRQNGIMTVWADGVPGTPVNVTGYGLDDTSTFYLGRFGTSAKFDGNIYYVRWDSEALTDNQLIREAQILLGIGASTGWDANMEFRRAGSVYQKFNDGSLALRTANMPRVGDGLLIEDSRAQLLTYTGALSTNWTKTNSSLGSTSVTLPDGTTSTTAILHEDAAGSSTHNLDQTISVTTGVSYCASFYVKFLSTAGTPRPWVCIYFRDGTNYKAFYADLQLGAKGSIAGSLADGLADLEPLGDGWFRIWVSATSGATSASGAFRLYIAESDGDIQFTGQDQDSLYMCWPQFEVGTYPTSYIPRPDATAVSRVADDYVINPLRFRDTVKDIVTSATPKTWLDFDQEPVGTTITGSEGTYTYTKAGTPKQITDKIHGHAHLFSGVSDYYKIADTGVGDPFRPTGNFSVVAIVTPYSVSAASYFGILSKYLSTGDQRAYRVAHDTGVTQIVVSHNGTSSGLTLASITGKLEAYKTSVITATYHTTNGAAIYLDAETPGTHAVGGSVFGSTAPFCIGSSFNEGGLFNGKIHYVAYYDHGSGAVLTQTDHNNIYAAVKNPGVLPLNIGSADHYKKLRVKFDYCGMAASQTGSLFEIGGNLGTADSNTNRIVVAMDSGNLKASLYANGEDTERYATYTVAHNKWNSVDLILDLEDLTFSTLTVNDVLGTNNASLAGAKTLKNLDTKARLGQNYAGTINGNCLIKDLAIFVAP